ncbi:MAG TPA: alpha/beta hydrolase-fold protein [Candidatus Eisenbacteria bacterium]|nr:alpha/beta hydrolase-fold protein [Candidatus Eisenbacteria bacterium]
MRPLRFCLLIVALLSTTAAIRTTSAARVSGISVTSHDGQTFVTWTSPPGTGWKYRVYASEQPIYFLSDFWNATFLGDVGDSTWCDRRLSSISGGTFGYATDSLATPLDSTRGLYVVTVPASAIRYYCVTAESSGRGEDRSFDLDQNTTLVAVTETVAPPRPIYQRTLTLTDGTNMDVYSLWASTTDLPGFPAMSNRPGAFDCGIVRGGTNGALMVRPHPRGGDFLQGDAGSGMAGEWRLALDDPWMNRDGNSFWYGWHENYDPENGYNTPPTSGVVRDYTWQRVLYTLLWARRTFSVDTTRVYAYGYSMGGIGSIFLALRRPDLFAGVMSIIGKMDFAFEADPNPASEFNPGGPLRDVTDKMWGPVPNDLPTPEGTGVYQQLDGNFLLAQDEQSGVPPILAFNGRNDFVVGWGEKPGFFNTMEALRLGGYFWWDPSDHASSVWSWRSMQDPKYLYRFRTNRSYPALSQCSADFHPGYGDWVSGDSIGTINGFVEWDTTIVDQPDRWEVTLNLRDLPNYCVGSLVSPDSMLVNVTPRRLQQFQIVPLGLYRWTTTRVSDGRVLRTGIEQADSTGTVTFYWVKVNRLQGGTTLHVERVLDVTGVPGGAAGMLRLSLGRNPTSGPARATLYWPASGPAAVELYDVSGRLSRTLWRGAAHAGGTTVTVDPRGLGSGVYFVVARQGEARATKRLVVVR